MLRQTKVAMKIISPREHHREISAQGKFQDEKQGTEERPQTEETPAEVLGDRLPGRRCRRRMNENRLFSEPLGSDPLSAWWLGLAPATLEFWVRFPNEMNQGRQAHPVLKYRVPHGAWWLGLAPATLEFWVRFPNERNPAGKTGAPCGKYRVPHRSLGLGAP